MAKNNETTTKFKVDISELKSAMQTAKRQIAVANSEFKAVSSSMDDWRNSTDGLTAKLEQLDSNLSSQKTILKSLQEQYELTVAEMGEGSAAADDLKIKINNQQAVVNSTEAEIRKYTEALDDLNSESETLDDSAQNVSDSLEGVADSAEDAGDGFTVLKGAVATFVGNTLSSLVSGLKDAASNLLNLADETREYRDQMTKLESAGTEAGYGVDYISEKYKELYGVLGDETASSTAVANFMAMGAEEETLNSLLDSSIGIWAKYGDSIPLDGLAEAINETSKVGTVTGGLADALNWAGVSEDEFNDKLAECTDEQERQKLIADTLNNIYGDLSDTYQENNKSIIEAREAQADYTDAMADLGAKAEPVTTALKEGVTELLKELLKLVEDVDITKFTDTLKEGFSILIDDVLPAVKDGLGWIIKNKNTLIAALSGIAAGFVAFKVASVIQGLVSAFKAWKLATEGMSIAQAALNLVMSANPIGLIIAAVAGLVAAFIALWTNCEEFRAFWIGLWENIKVAFETVINAIIVFFTETIPAAIDGMIEFLSELPTKIGEWLTNAIDTVAEWSANMVTKAKELGSSFIDKVIEFFNQLPSMLGYALGYAIAQVIQWGIDLYDFATTKIPEFIGTVITFFSELPSKVWEWLTNTINNIADWGADMLTRGQEIATGFIDNVINIIKNLPTKVWTWLNSTIGKVGDFALDLVVKAREAANGLVNNIVNIITGLPDKMVELGANIVEGLWNGINSMADWIGGKLKSFSDGVLSGIKAFFGIHSPSRVMRDEVGKWLPEGIAVGIDKNAKSVLSSMRDLTGSTLEVAREGLNSGITGTGVGNSVVNNFNQVINSPKSLSRLEIYRQSKNLLGYAGGGA